MRCPLAIVIVNYKTPDLVVDCLRTLVADVAVIPDCVVVIVDNASGDGSADRIEKAIADEGWGGWARLMRSSVNGGFAAGNNIALRAVQADRYLLLNSDTLVHSGAIVTMMRAMDARDDVGFIGPRLQWPDGKPQESCFNFRTPITEFLAAARTGPLSALFRSHQGTLPLTDEAIEPDWTTFACCLIRREVLDQVGLLDEGYFLYFDDIDLCRRGSRAGWKVLYCPQARVIHLRGKSGPVKQMTLERKRRPRYFYVSRNRYYAKFYGRLGAWAANVLWELGRCVAWCRELVGHKQPHTCEREARDIWTNGLNPMKPPRGQVGS